MRPITREIAADFLARLLVGALFAMLSVNILVDFARTARVTGLLLLVSEALVVVLMVLRRRARVIEHSMWAGIVTALSIAGPPLLRVTDGPGLLPDVVTAMASSVGLIVVIAGKVTLGRSFGLLPANRGVVIGGPYAFVRHPIYSGYLLTHLAFVVANPTPANIVTVLCADTALAFRALIEERTLSADGEYREYCGRVAWHLVPGVF